MPKMSDPDPSSPKARGNNPAGGGRSLEDELGDMRVEDLGDVEPVDIAADVNYDSDQQDKEKAKAGKGKDKAKKRRSSEQPRRKGPALSKQPTIIANAYDAFNKAPAYVAPIPKIGSIPSVAGVTGVGPPEPPPRSSSSAGKDGDDRIPSSGRPKIPRWVTESMIGKRIDEYGDVVDDDGKVLGRVAGDLPSMVGRTVLNQRGDVLGDDGELLGYVAEVAEDKGKGAEDQGAEKDESDAESESDEEAEVTSEPKSIDQYIGKPSASLQVDHRGNILDSFGNIIGHFRDTSMDPKPGDQGGGSASAAAAGAGGQPGARKPAPGGSSGQGSAPPRPSGTQNQGAAGSSAAAGGDKPDRPKNASDWRKEGESPSDIFLDVKSTTEGIQLTIRIPTVFAGGQQPRVNFV